MDSRPLVTEQLKFIREYLVYFVELLPRRPVSDLLSPFAVRPRILLAGVRRPDARAGVLRGARSARG